MLEYDVLWPPILVATVANMALGFLWYSSPVFGRPWMRETGKTMDQIKKGSNAFLYLGAIAGAFIVSFAVGLLIENTFTETIVDAVLLSLLLWAAFFLVPTFVNYAFEGRSWMLYLIYVAHQLVGFLLSAVIYFLWWSRI